MRFHSTPESVQSGEITQLAIIECVIAVAIYVGIGMYFRTFQYLAVAVALAPLTLLRTDASVRWGLEKWDRIWDLPARLPVWGPLAGLFGLASIVAGSAIRLSATLYWALRRPLDTLEAMPRNWLRQSFCTDLFYPPEVVPPETIYGDHTKIPSFRFWATALPSEKKAFGRVSLLLGGLIFFLPPLVYRISFKATSLAYSPFVWVAHATLRTPEAIKLRFERITKGELEKTRRWMSGFIGLALVTKVALVLGWIDVSAALARFPSKRFVEFLSGNTWPWWVITLGIDALMTFCLLWYADAALARLEGKDAWQEETITKTVSTASFLRASLGIVTMSHFFYVALTTVVAGHVQMPAL